MDTDQQLWGLVANPFDSAGTPILVLSLSGVLMLALVTMVVVEAVV